eukprot:9966205-Alexandrium_andersonii.AAC.1
MCIRDSARHRTRACPGRSKRSSSLRSRAASASTAPSNWRWGSGEAWCCAGLRRNGFGPHGYIAPAITTLPAGCCFNRLQFQHMQAT